MCCDRTTFLKEAINSILAAIKNTQAEVIFYISDNSIGNTVEIFLQKTYPKLSTRKRTVHMNIEQHHNLIIHESQTEFLMMLHDDDKIHPKLIDKLFNEIVNDDTIGAIAGNSNIINSNGVVIKRNCFSSKSRKLNVSEDDDLLKYYFNFIRNGHVPFPSYMYRTAAIKDFIWSKKTGGKYSDVSMLCHILKGSRIVWLNDVLFSYREHSRNGNKTLNIIHKIWLYKHLKAHCHRPTVLYKLRLRTHISIIRSRKYKLSSLYHLKSIKCLAKILVEK